MLEADALKTIERRTFLSDNSRHENSAEHSWHLALSVWVLSEFAPPETDLLGCLKLALVHDLVEIHAGDTYVYDLEALKTQNQREILAAELIFGLLPQRDEFRALWDEFEAKTTNEARFVGAVDRLLPMILNFQTRGRAWRTGKVRRAQVENLNLPALECAPQLQSFARLLIESAVEKDFLAE